MMKFKLDLQMDMTIDDKSLPKRKQTRIPKKKPMGNMSEIVGDKEFIKKKICDRIDKMASYLEDWFENC